MADPSSAVAGSPSKVTDSPGKMMVPLSKAKDSPAKMEESVSKWKAFAGQFEKLTICEVAVECDPTHAVAGTFDTTNRIGDTDNAGKLANEEFIGGFPARPVHFYRSDGKLFHRQFDISMANKVDDGWDDDEVVNQVGYFNRPTCAFHAPFPSLSHSPNC